MEGLYAECSVKKCRNREDTLYKMLIVIGTIYIILALYKFASPFVGMMGIGAAAFLVPYFIKQFNVEYEYILCDDQLDFDIIKGGLKRRRYLRILLENAEFLAPLDNEKIDQYKVDTVVKLYSRKQNAEPYALVVKKNDKLLKIIFEPNKKMLKNITFKMPRRYILKEEDKQED